MKETAGFMYFCGLVASAKAGYADCLLLLVILIFVQVSTPLTSSIDFAL